MLTIVLLIAGLLTLLGGFGIFSVAKSAIHEIEAFLLFIISAVCLSGVTVAEAVNRLRKDMINRSDSVPAQPTKTSAHE